MSVIVKSREPNDIEIWELYIRFGEKGKARIAINHGKEDESLAIVTIPVREVSADT